MERWASICFGLVLLLLCTVGCSHNMHITNLDENFVAPSPPPVKLLRLGIESVDAGNREKALYIDSIVRAARNSGNFEHVIFPYNHAIHAEIVDVVADISIAPEYKGEGSNFVVNWPGFLIFAPAIWGYGYQADINTVVNISRLEQKQSQDMSTPLKYKFRHADISRTWTEIGWLEFGVIPLIGAFVFTQYDNDITDEFISKASNNYGNNICQKLTTAVYSSTVASIAIP